MMCSDSLHSSPLVSVIIPCYNQGRFLHEAIKSVEKQTYPTIEIIVIDDGSTDETQSVARSFAKVKYFYQANAGLSAARNAGIARSNGLYLVFLDADDILYEHAVELNLRHLVGNPAWAFVSGGHDKVDEWLYPLHRNIDEMPLPNEHAYLSLLQGNYIGMHAAVMYRSRVFNELRFDENLKACEDYDLYLRIARQWTVGCHPAKVAAYRHHSSNMSLDYVRMLDHVMLVHRRQLPHLKNKAQKDAWGRGVKIWKDYYAQLLYDQCVKNISKDRSWPRVRAMKILAMRMPGRFRNYAIKKLRYNFLHHLKRALPHLLLRWLHHAGLYKHYTPPPGRVEPGDFKRLTPFSSDFGFDRGGAIDRFYIETFLHEHQARVEGRVLEIGDNEYTMKYGGRRVLQSDILHVDHTNTRATFIGDITDVPQIPSGQFDCIIFTQTLHLIYDFRSALRTCYRLLKPGGCLLLTVPGISHIDKGEWRDYWLWSFTDTSIKKLMAETFNGSSVAIQTYGNVYVAAAFLYGMGLPEFRKEFLFHHDPSYQVIISAAAIKG